MSRYDDDDDDEFSSDNGNIDNVRKALRAAEKRLKVLETENAGYRAESRKTTLAKTIEGKNLNPLIAGLVPKDLSDGELDTWLDEYGSLFAPAGAPAAPPASEPGLVPDGAATFNEVANTGEVPNDDYGQLMARMDSAKTKEDLDLVIFGHKL